MARGKTRSQTPPAAGDRIRLRGRPPTGSIVVINEVRPGMLWCDMRWDEGCDGPLICHRNELEKMEAAQAA